MYLRVQRAHPELGTFLRDGPKQRKALLPNQADKKRVYVQMIPSNSLAWLCFKRRSTISETEKDHEENTKLGAHKMGKQCSA